MQYTEWRHRERPVLDALIAAQLKRIVYVSCEPSTSARDLAILSEGGYTLQSVQPLDMYPHSRAMWNQSRC